MTEERFLKCRDAYELITHKNPKVAWVYPSERRELIKALAPSERQALSSYGLTYYGLLLRVSPDIPKDFVVFE